MKHLVKLSLVLFLLNSIPSFSQSSLPEHSLTLKRVWMNYQAPNRDQKNLFTDLDHGFELGYNWHFSKFLSLGIPLRAGSAKFPIYDEPSDRVVGYGRRNTYVGLDALLNLHLCRGKLFSPFVYGGIGASVPSFDFDNFHAQVPIGLGLDIRVDEQASIVLQSDYRTALKDDYDNWQHAIGVRIGLGRSDRDKDGWSDDEDPCPDEFGTLGGCPDSDNDGIANAADKCPNEAGVAENNGCPSDMDKDGVYDRDDLCPKLAGPVSLKGCPDRDNDGVSDMDDACPDVAGTLKGCPDTDRDGLADKDDKCPNVAGPVSNMGCPPDRDKDGFPDATDPCPDLAGTYNGCPDSDGDGLADNLDKCPFTKGVASNNGCPEIKVEDKKVLEVAMRSVQFQTGTALLTKASNKKLDDVVGVLKRYPEMILSIEGHTDDVGQDMDNLKLSVSRAQACQDYLAKKGIPTSRLMSNGYGETKPIGDNKTAAGRQTNRRVEFNPIWR